MPLYRLLLRAWYAISCKNFMLESVKAAAQRPHTREEN